MLISIAALLLLQEIAALNSPEEIAEIRALCQVQGTPVCAAGQVNVDLYTERTIQGVNASETLIFCRGSRPAAVTLVDSTLRRVVQNANLAIRYNDATDNLVVYVVERESAAPARYWMEADLSGIPVEAGARVRCTLRMKTARVQRNAQGGVVLSQDGFTQQVNGEVYAAAARPF